MADSALPVPERSNQTATPAEAPAIRNSEPKKTTDAMVTLLPVILTAATFLLSFSFQIHQQAQQNKFQREQVEAQDSAAVDSEFRKALEQVIAKDGSSAAVGAYEMESFLDSKHGSQARAIAASLLPKIDDKFAFDVLFFDLLAGVTQQNQNQIVTINGLLTSQLKDLYWKALHKPRRTQLPKDSSFRAFVQRPELFFPDTSDSDQLNQALTKAWELESVSNGLSDIWTGQLGNPHPTPAGQELDDLVFIGNNFQGVDFQQAASMSDVDFYGDCNVQGAKFPAQVKPECTK
jgi:hypothetical protein